MSLSPKELGIGAAYIVRIQRSRIQRFPAKQTGKSDPRDCRGQSWRSSHDWDVFEGCSKESRAKEAGIRRGEFKVSLSGQTREPLRQRPNRFGLHKPAFRIIDRAIDFAAPRIQDGRAQSGGTT